VLTKLQSAVISVSMKSLIDGVGLSIYGDGDGDGDACPWSSYRHSIKKDNVYSRDSFTYRFHRLGYTLSIDLWGVGKSTVVAGMDRRMDGWMGFDGLRFTFRRLSG